MPDITEKIELEAEILLALDSFRLDKRCKYFLCYCFVGRRENKDKDERILQYRKGDSDIEVDITIRKKEK